MRLKTADSANIRPTYPHAPVQCTCTLYAVLQSRAQPNGHNKKEVAALHSDHYSLVQLLELHVRTVGHLTYS